MKKVATNGPMKAFTINLSNFFTFAIIYLYRMQFAKIHLSPQQIKLVTDPEWILTKNEILRQLKDSFSDLHTAQQNLIKAAGLPEEVLQTIGKISRGENYLGLPWIVLDNPRHFIRHHIFAVRTMFWWGKYFSTTLHLSGKWQEHFRNKLSNAHSRLQQNNFTICHNGNEWVHDVLSESFTPINRISLPSFEAILAESPFIKIAACTGMENIENATEILMEQFGFLIDSVSNG